MDWDRFTFEYVLDISDVSFLRSIISIEAYKQAALNLVLPPDWKNQLDRLNRVRAVYGTTALEGNPLSEAEVSHQIEVLDQQGEREGSNKTTKEQLQIRNAGSAQSWVRERFYPGARPLDVADIFKMHRMITEHSDTKDNIPGKLRTFGVTVGSPDTGGVHKGAPHADLSRLMEEYIEFVNSKKLSDQHPVIRALLAHFFLVTIHPFGDGNGRVSRLVEAGILYEAGYNVLGFYGLSNYFYRREQDYKTHLQKCRELQPFDVTPFVLFGIEGFSTELQGINNFIKTKLNRIVYRTMLVRALNQRAGSRRRLLNGREYNLLDFLLKTTEPNDPFSENPSKGIKLSELMQDPFILGTYKNVTRRTFYRELVRLELLGFISYRRDEAAKESTVQIDFDAIGKH